MKKYKKCQYCNEQIPIDSKRCPYCDEEIKEDFVEDENEKNSLEATRISNAELEIASNKDCTKNVNKVITGTERKASIPNITKEIKVPK